MTRPRTILLLRADGIGDHILSSGLLPLLNNQWPDAQITVLCPNLVKELFQVCPFVARVIPFDPKKVRSIHGRWKLKWDLHGKFDLAINSVHSRDLISDFLARQIRAKRFIAFQGDTSNQNQALLRKHDAAYSEFVDTGADHQHFLTHLNKLAQHLGLKGEVEPTAWIGAGDEAYADSLLRNAGAGSEPFLAFFPGAGSALRHYGGYAEALKTFLVSHSTNLIALGSPGDRELVSGILSELGIPEAFNFCGRTTLPQAAAILSRASLAVGAESGLAHIAWAVGTPQVIVLGGGHFGRFMPRSPLTTVACLPMKCYGCNWDCRFDRPHCIQDLPPETLGEAIAVTWLNPSPVPRVFSPNPSPAPEGYGTKPPQLPGDLSAACFEAPWAVHP